MHKSLATLWQRAGRAARSPGLRGRFTFLFEGNWYCGLDEYSTVNPPMAQSQRAPLNAVNRMSQRDVDEEAAVSQPSTPRSKEKKKSSQSSKGNQPSLQDMKATANRSKAPRSFLEFINTTGCRRSVVLRFFDNVADPLSNNLDHGEPLYCCDGCHPSQVGLSITDHGVDEVASTAAKKNALRGRRAGYDEFLAALKVVEKRRAVQRFAHRNFPAVPGSFVPHEKLQELAKATMMEGHLPRVGEFQDILGPSYYIPGDEASEFLDECKAAWRQTLTARQQQENASTVACGASDKPYNYTPRGTPTKRPRTPSNTTPPSRKRSQVPLNQGRPVSPSPAFSPITPKGCQRSSQTRAPLSQRSVNVLTLPPPVQA